MYKVIGVIVIVAFLGISAGPVLAKTENTSSIQEIIQALQEQIAKIKAQIEVLISQIQNWEKPKSQIKETEEEAEEILELLKQLKKGTRGDDVELLQEFLATDPEIYPEGYVTGYFGKLTEKAVKKFQKLANIKGEDGIVGSKTLSKINELLEEGAGSSGKVPPGLLVAPGIKKKLGYSPEAPEGQDLPHGIEKKLDDDDGDSESPFISDISVLDVTSSSAKIIWKTDEKSNSTVWYDIITPLVINSATKTKSSSSLVFDHAITLSGLVSVTNYYYKVGSSDILGNATSSSERVFTTF
ncbi:MAG: peptidoglycan-binding protein [bacterium]|nr:peptidoglycan-binding protein [bacterium]